MEIRILQDEHLANAAGLSRFVFDNCLRNRMEFPPTLTFVEDYLKVENLQKMREEGTLTIWGVFEQEQLVGVSGLQSDGMITMLYILPQFMKKAYASALLLEMREYANAVYGYEKVMVNATPAWTAYYFLKRGFSFVSAKQNMHVPFVTMSAPYNNLAVFKKKYVPGKFIALAIIACFVFATIIGSGFMIWYLF